MWKREVNPDTGRGVVATRDIARGERIMAEAPLAEVHNPIPANEWVGVSLKIFYAFAAIPREENHHWLVLHAPQPKIDRDIVEFKSFVPGHFRVFLDPVEAGMAHAIFKTNAIQGRGSEEGMWRLFPGPSTMSHSCTPNTEMAWNHSLRCMTVHAIEKIPAGAEITRDYIGEIGDAAFMNDQLQTKFGIECNCKTCEHMVDEDGEVVYHNVGSAVNRLEYKDLDSRRRGSSRKPSEKIADMRKMLDILEAEDLVGKRMSDLQEDLAWMYLSQDDKENFRRYRALAFETAKVYLGPDHRRTIDLQRDPTTHQPSRSF